MMLRKGQLPIFIVHAIALLIFTFIFIYTKNYEFIAYVGVIITAMALVLATNERVNYSNSLLWGLTIWSIMHMAGGGLFFNGTRLYNTMIANLVGEPYNILRYDQVLHAFGFAVATLLSYQILKPYIPKKSKKWFAISAIIFLSGMGLGALNEVIEFGTTLFISTGVGDYVNNALDLVFNMIGVLIATIYLRIRKFNV